MAGSRLQPIGLLLIAAIALQIGAQKILSSKKRCGDPQCEGRMIRASAKRDYSGPDCRFLHFRTGEEISVYYKLTGEREDLWQGSTGKAYGFFPRDAVNIEEVYVSEEVEVPAQEIDFVCLDGGEYVFENEDSILHQGTKAEFLEALDTDMGKETTIKGVSTENPHEDVPPKEPRQDPEDKPGWASSGFASWFGIGRTQDKKEPETNKEQKPEEHLPSEEENKGAESKEPEQVHENKGTESKDPEEVQSEKSGWLGGRLQNFLPFGRKATQASVESDSAQSEEVVDTDKENFSLPQEAEKETISEIDHKEESKWLNFNIKNALGFGAKEEPKTEDLQDRADEEVMSPAQEDVRELPAEHERSDISTEGQSSTSMSKNDQEELLSIQEDPTTSNEPDKGGSGKSSLVIVDVEVDRVYEKEGNAQENPRDAKAAETNYKSSEPDVMDLGKQVEERVQEVQAIQELNHNVQSPDTAIGGDNAKLFHSDISNTSGEENIGNADSYLENKDESEKAKISVGDQNITVEDQNWLTKEELPNVPSQTGDSSLEHKDEPVKTLTEDQKWLTSKELTKVQSRSGDPSLDNMNEPRKTSAEDQKWLTSEEFPKVPNPTGDPSSENKDEPGKASAEDQKWLTNEELTKVQSRSVDSSLKNTDNLGKTSAEDQKWLTSEELLQVPRTPGDPSLEDELGKTTMLAENQKRLTNEEFLKVLSPTGDPSSENKDEFGKTTVSAECQKSFTNEKLHEVPSPTGVPSLESKDELGKTEISTEEQKTWTNEEFPKGSRPSGDPSLENRNELGKTTISTEDQKWLTTGESPRVASPTADSSLQNNDGLGNKIDDQKWFPSKELPNVPSPTGDPSFQTKDELRKTSAEDQKRLTTEVLSPTVDPSLQNNDVPGKPTISMVNQPISAETKSNRGLHTDIMKEAPGSSKPGEESYCYSGEESAHGSCMGQPRRYTDPKEETPTQRQALTYPILPSAEEMMLILKWTAGKCLEIYQDFVLPAWSASAGALRQAVSLLPEDLQPGPDFYGCSWEVVAVTALVGFITVLTFTCRTLRCIKSRFYAGREVRLGQKVAELLDGKSEVLEKLSLVQKQYEEVQQSLQESGHQKLREEMSEQKALQETLQTSNKELEENIARLEKDLEEERRRGSELDTTLSELNEKIKALEENFTKEKSQKEEIRTTQKVFEINKERLESSLEDAEEEQTRLQESIKQLSEEAEGWEERFSELSENSKMISSSVQAMQDDLGDKQGQVKSLIDSLLTMKDWSSDVEGENPDNEDLEDVLSSIKWDFENGEPLGDPQKRTIKKLIFAAMLNASLKSTESEKKQLYENLSDEMKAREQLSECITNLQNTNQSLSLEKGHLEEEVEKLKQKMSVMMEVYQENEQKLHRKLTVQEKERLQKEAKLSKADEKATLASTELVTVKTRLAELEEETDRTVASYQTQVTSYEKKAHDNWLTARAAERYLSDVKKETLHLRQKLTEAEYKSELLEKDPFALDVIQAIGRESSPYGLSPINRLPEGRAFLSPPTLLEGPLRLSPMSHAADRGMRPPGYYPAYPGAKGGDANADRKSDHQRTLSDAGSLSPPWDREQRSSAPPPGLPYPEPPFPPRRADRFYHYPAPSGRFSGPAELTRNQGKPFMDSSDGRSSPEYRLRGTASRNGSEEANNVPGAPTMEGEAMDGPEYGMHHHPPPMRVPLLPMDPRAPFFRRPFPMPPHPPMEMYGPPPGYPGMPPPHLAMRGPLPPPRFPVYPMPNEPFYPPQHPRPQMRNEPPMESQPVPLPMPADHAPDNPSEAQT